MSDWASPDQFGGALASAGDGGQVAERVVRSDETEDVEVDEDDDDSLAEMDDDEDDDDGANGGGGGDRYDGLPCLSLGDGGADDASSPPPELHHELIDIRAPLASLRTRLEERTAMDLSEHRFFLQRSQELDENSSLVEQCIQGEGMVQVVCDIREEPLLPDGKGPVVKKINIEDVLKPTEEEEDDVDVGGDQADISIPPEEDEGEARRQRKKRKRSDSPGGGADEEDLAQPAVKAEKAEEKSGRTSPQQQVTRWMVDARFRAEQKRLGIPVDPKLWSQQHVQYWVRWAARQFSNASISQEDWHGLGGDDLVDMTHEQFKRMVPIDPQELLWTHIELLRKCKFVAVVQRGGANAPGSSSSAGGGKAGGLTASGKPSKVIPRQTAKKPPVRLGSAKFTVMSESSLGSRSGNNGQVQLWQFLLELLTDKKCRNVIHWTTEDGEFKLEDPEAVAQMWGDKKGKKQMNYEKLSRALRYYYDGDMISKVTGKRFAYKFVCDLEDLLGYDAATLNRLVKEAEEKSKGARAWGPRRSTRKRF